MRVEEIFRSGGVMMVAAHPDDETIGCGGHFPLLRDAIWIHVTDGAPRGGRDAAAAGFAGWQDYARARREEMLRALDLAGIPNRNALELGIPDQEASFEMAAIARNLAGLFRRFRPGVVFTHPYEGGHPDHDVAAFAVRSACALVDHPPDVWEFTSYHARGEGMATGEFLPGPAEIRAPLAAEAQRLKRRLFDCFATQQNVLRQFRIDEERFRPAPVYDFHAPPHPGALYYERFDWGITAPRWRELAREAVSALGIEAAA